MSKKRFRRRSRSVQHERLESRQLLAAGLGATTFDTGEFLLGTVAVTPVFFESNGAIDPQTQNWSATEIDQVLSKVTEGTEWWATALDELDTVHTLDFVRDDTYATTPFDTGYELIDRSSSDVDRAVGDFLIARGYGDADSIEHAVQLFNDEQRQRLDADWAFTIFVVDSSDDPDGSFASGPFSTAFAFPGGLHIVTPSTRPASTIAHEMGHMFWARDEYPGGGSWTDRRGYYNAQNLNAADNPNQQQQDSIMQGGIPLSRAYGNFSSPASTLAMVGWQDTDGDGIFDVSDVPLALDAVGYFDDETSIYHFTGTAEAVPLTNRNSSGYQSDITLNRISELQYRVDGGLWMTISEPDQQRLEFDLAIPLVAPFDTIEFRAIDLSTTIASPVLPGSQSVPAVSSGGVRGYAFVDSNSNGQRDAGEPLLTNTQVKLTHADGAPLLSGEYHADDFSAGEGLPTLDGITLSAEGPQLRSQLEVLPSGAAGGVNVFQAFDNGDNEAIDRWNEFAVFEAVPDEPVGEIEVTVIGLDDGSYARVEAFDAAGNRLTRSTSEIISSGESASVIVSDPQGRIAKIRAFGHARTDIAISGVRFGANDSMMTEESGAWRISVVAAGYYRLQLTGENLIHQFSDIDVQIGNGDSEMIVGAAMRVDSPRYNAAMAEDVSGNGDVSPRDALLVINDLIRSGARVLGTDETTGVSIDVNNDGSVTPLDALLVINHLSRRDPGGEPEWSPAGSSVGGTSASFTAADAVMAEWDAGSGDQSAIGDNQGQGSDMLESSADIEQEKTYTQMLNSAGRSGSDESIAPSETDTRRDSGQFVAFPGKNGHPNALNRGAELAKPESASQTESEFQAKTTDLIVLFDSEFAEPSTQISI